ncbi:hypothetical protein K438DRAFT_1977454 [Mycena galopus ATCC 62051]|nr:hypothetical protein K438DRAFT_1977454 [Mycena galopus ATCC 62051]
MHPALQLDNLRHLPPSMRRAAQSACSAGRTIQDIRRVQTYLASATQEQSLLLLPVFYTNLDPAEIPGLAHFDQESPPGPHVESSIGRAWLSLQSLYVIQFPIEIGPDMWPCAWPWCNFFYTYREYLPNILPPPDDTFCLEFLMFAGTFAEHEETFSLILSTPEVRFMVSKAWPHIPGILDAKKRELAFTDLQSFIAHETTAKPNNLAEIIDGAGGTPDDLARLIVLYIQAMLPNQGTPIHFTYVHFACVILDFVIRIEPVLGDEKETGVRLGAIGTALVSQNVVKALIDLASALGKSTSTQARSALRKTFMILGSIFMAKPMKIRQFCDALDDKLLHSLVVCGRGPNGAGMKGFIKLFLEVLIPPHLVYPEALSALDRALDDVDELVTHEDFKNTAWHEYWVQFSNLAEDRIAILKSCEVPSMRACDNLECGAIRPRRELARCSTCKTVYYCDEACQAADWAGGGHRNACESYVALSLRTGNNLDFTMRSFLRALIHHDYQKDRRTILLQKMVFWRARPDDGFLTLYDYTRGPVRIVLQPLNSAKTHEVLGSIEWTNIVSRAERSAGRMCLDVLVFSRGEGFQYYVIPLRSNKSTLHDGLRALADEFPPDVEHWDEDFVIDRFQRFVDLNDEEGELVEVH